MLIYVWKKRCLSTLTQYTYFLSIAPFDIHQRKLFHLHHALQIHICFPPFNQRRLKRKIEIYFTSECFDIRTYSTHKNFVISRWYNFSRIFLSLEALRKALKYILCFECVHDGEELVCENGFLFFPHIKSNFSFSFVENKNSC